MNMLPNKTSCDAQDFSRLFLHLNHHEYNPNVPMPTPGLVRLLGVPEGKNVGITQVPLTEEISIDFLQHHNNNNRNMVEDRTYSMTQAMENGTFVEDNPDTLQFDSLSEMISGQKRVKARANVGSALHPKYEGVIWMRVEYGLPPVHRGLSDNNQVRADADAFRWLTNMADNRQLHQLLKLAYTMYSGRTSSTFVCNVDDRKRVYGAHQVAFRWMAGYKVPSRTNLQTTAVRLALVELYMQSPEKAELVADALYHASATSGKFVQPIRALADYCEAALRYKRAPLGTRCGGTQSILVYKAVVPFFDAALLNKKMEPTIPPARAMAKGWSNFNAKERFTAALTGRVPAIKAVTKYARNGESKATDYAQATRSAQRHGVVSAASVFAAFALLNPTAKPGEAQQLIEENTKVWNDITRLSRGFYGQQPLNQRLIQPSALVAFLYRHVREKDDVVAFLTGHFAKIMVHVARIIPRGKSQRANGSDVLGYLTRAYAAIKDNKTMPST